MAGKIDAEFMKKHHFWLLLIPGCLFAFLACIMLFTDVAAETEKKDGENKTKKTDIDKAKASPKATVAKLDDLQLKLKAQQREMWKQAWSEQKDLFKWPAGYPSTPEFAEVKQMPFGSLDLDKKRYTQPIRALFRDLGIYRAEYAKLVESVAPMQFQGDWSKVLRGVVWNAERIPNAEDVWLALEDLWVQREIVKTVSSVNEKAARFVRRPDVAWFGGGAVAPVFDRRALSGDFESQIWEVELRVERKEGPSAPKGAGNYIVGRIRNISPRLQVFGLNNLLKIKIWFNDDKGEPFIFDIEGTSLPGDPDPKDNRPDKWQPIKTIGRHLLPSDIKPVSIFKVEQMFDTRTVPVKRIEAMSLGKLSDRNSNLVLVPSEISKKMEAPAPAAATGAKDPASPGLPGKALPGGPAPPAPGGPPAPAGPTPPPAAPIPGMPGMPGGMAGQPEAQKITTSLSGLPRQRYLATTEQVRRMPLGLTVLTDQAYMNEILQAFANTKLRFQPTQSHWTRFHGTLDYGTAPAAPTQPGAPAFPGQFAAVPTSNRDDQFSANLLEVSIYGIINLYEKFPDTVEKSDKIEKTEKTDKTDPKKK